MALPSLAHVPQYFKYTYEGQTYAFETTSDSTCMVRHIIGDSGSVIIPAVAKDVFDSYYDGVEFTVTALGSACFLDQKNIVSVEIPNSVTEVGERAFYGCTGLTSIEIPNSVTEITENLFVDCTSLASVVIPESVIEIGRCAFTGCSSLTSIEIPTSVTEIGEIAFSGCTSLTSVNLPRFMYTIGKYVFQDCNFIKTIYYNATQVIEGEKDIFTYEVYENATLYVGEDGLDYAYNTCPWSYFKKIYEIDFSGVDDIVTDSDDNEIDFTVPLTVYNLQGAIVSDSVDGLPGGVYIVRQGRKTKKFVVK